MPKSKLYIEERFLTPEACEILINAFREVMNNEIYSQNGSINCYPLRTEMPAYVFKSAGELQAFEIINGLRREIITKITKHFNAEKLYPEFTLLSNNREGDQHILHADAERYAGDDTWVPNHTPERSFTGMVYLNSSDGVDFSGGEIDFPFLKKTISPKVGLLVGFRTNHEYIHQVFPVNQGERFAVSFWMTPNAAVQEGY